MMETKINNFEQLVAFIEGNDLSLNDLNSLIQNSIGTMIVMSKTKEEVLINLHKYWNLYGKNNRRERPIFLDIDNPLNF